MSDHDVRGHFRRLVAIATSEWWKEIWDDLAVETVTLEEVGLSEVSSDREIWLTCQQEDIVLITGNRNREGEESLEETIRQLNSAMSLPVLTLSDPRRIRDDPDFADRTAEKLLEYLMDLDRLLGTGRLFIP